MNIYTKLLEFMCQEKKISAIDLAKLNYGKQNLYDPESVTAEMQAWYISLGIEQVTNRSFSLEPCPFSREEIKELYKNNEMLICIPKNVTLKEMARLFRLETWAVEDPLVVSKPEKQDLWMKTSSAAVPQFMGNSGIEIKQLAEEKNWISFSLNYYMVFIARYQYLFRQNPDYRYWIWLPKGRYDRSGMLIAGFDINNNFNVHGWMPHFTASFLGARFLISKR